MLDPSGTLSTPSSPTSDDEWIGRQVNGEFGDYIFKRPNGTCYIVSFNWSKGWQEKFDVPCPTKEVRLMADPLKGPAPGRTDPTTAAETAWNWHKDTQEWDARMQWGFGNGNLSKNLRSCGAKRECIKHITIIGHGGPGFSAGFSTRSMVAAFQGVVFCRDCEIKLHTCNSGVAPKGGEAIAAALVRATGCRSYGTKGFCSGFGRGMKIWPKYAPDGTIEDQGKPLFAGNDCYENFEPPQCFLFLGKDGVK